MTAVVRADARTIPLLDETVDLIVTSPPYWNQRSYRDGGEHYDGQIGSEPSAREFLEALWEVTAECWRVLKPTGSMWVNLGDKRAGSGAPGTTNGLAVSQKRTQGDRSGMVKTYDRVDDERSGLASGGRVTRAYGGQGFGRKKSKMLLPHRYAIGCEDGLADRDGIGWIVRQDQVWHKRTGLPEPTRDRTQDKHEYWFHLAKIGDYYADVDPIREPHTGGSHDAGPNATTTKWQSGQGETHRTGRTDSALFNPLGKVPSSVWSIGGEQLVVPEHLDVEHFAAFPSEWPRRLILGWSPSGICTACGAGRRSITETARIDDRSGRAQGREGDSLARAHGPDGRSGERYSRVVEITGQGCACADPSAPTRPAVVLDPFGGTGTVAMVARALGRTGISLDLSADYGRLARWRIFESGGAAKARTRTNRDRQGVML